VSASAIISAILALIKSIPWFQDKFDQLMMAYAEQQIRNHEKKFIEAMAVLMATGDQTKLEEAIGSDNAGKPALRRDGIRERARNETPTDPTTSL
jgi:hypothetical protein